MQTYTYEGNFSYILRKREGAYGSLSRLSLPR